MGALRLTLAIAFCGLAGGTALAADTAPAPHSAITGFIVDMRQTVSNSGARVVDTAEQLLSKLELGGVADSDMHSGGDVLAVKGTDQVATRIAKFIPLGAAEPDTAPAKTSGRHHEYSRPWNTSDVIADYDCLGRMIGSGLLMRR